MFVWETDKVLNDLKKLPNVEDVKNIGPGGDYDTSELVVCIKGVKHERIHVSGFYSTEETIPNPDHSTIQWVQITDGQDSRGGLNSSNRTTAEVYFEVRQYFVDRNVQVIRHYDQIF